MIDSRKLLLALLAIAVLMLTAFPLLYPLAVAAAAYCEQRLSRRHARLAAIGISLAILVGTALTQVGLLPLIGPWRVAGHSVPSGWSSWALAAASTAGVWAVLIRSPRAAESFQLAPAGLATGLRAASPNAADPTAADPTAADPSAASLTSPDSDDFLPPHVWGAVDEDSRGPPVNPDVTTQRSASKADQPTQICQPSPPSNCLHPTYDLDAQEVLPSWLGRTSLESFRSELLAAKLSTIDPATLPAVDPASNLTAAQLAQRLFAAGQLTPFQAVLICAQLPALLRIGEYDVLDRLGRGGMAIVLRVRHRVTGHLYALKLLEPLDPLDPADPSIRNRFLREMDAVRGLAHPNIAVARSVGHQHGRLHIVMELVEGQNLAQLVADQGPLSPERALTYAAQAARALAHAHQRGLVHRDVKPGNLMLGPGEQIKLVDMGLARFFDAVESASARKNQAWHTRTGHLIGTIDYMAPEQAEELGLCDVRSDIYSLGCTLFFLLSGTSHLRGRTQRRRAMALVSCQGMIELSALRQDLPPTLYALVSRMTQLDPDARFQTMAEVLEAMENGARELGVTLSPGDTGCRILVVEDSLVQSLVTRQNLAAISPHFSTGEVGSLAAAIEACRQQRFDIVLLDLNLPDSSGVATVTSLRQVDAVTPILVMTNSSQPQLSAACLAAGADDFLPKQEIEPAMLQRHILLAIARKRNCR